MKASRRGQAGWILGAILIMFYALLPVAWIVSLSFKAGDDITNKKFWPTSWSFENYDIVFSSDLFTTALRNSVGISLIATLISVVLPVLLALISDPFSAVWVILAFIIIQQIEGNLLQPIVMSRAVDLHPALVIFAILVMGTLFGLIGVFLAVPLVAVLQVLVRELWVQKMDQMGNDPNPPAREPPKRKLPDPISRALKALRPSRRT